MKLANQRLGSKGIIVLIAFLTSMAPIISDVYMAALPTLVNDLGTSETLGSTTITVCFFTSAFGMLIMSPVSDKFGRKPVLLCCALLGTFSCLGCAFCNSIEFLIAMRCIVGFASGGLLATATAVVGDLFDGQQMTNVVSVIQALNMIMPVAAPLIGAAIFNVAGWRAEFGFMAAAFFIGFLGSLLLKESLTPEKTLQGPIMESFKGLFIYLKKPKFTLMVLVGSFFMTPYMAYLGVASFVYINHFGMSETMFSVFFAIASLVALAGPLVNIKISQLNTRKVIWVLIGIAALTGVAVLLVGDLGPFGFLGCMIPFLFTATIIRPLITSLSLQQADSNVGAASAVLNFCLSIIGTIGMSIGSLGWGNHVIAQGIIILASLLISTMFWIPLNKRQKR